jgi:hypothetical protein
LSGKPVRKDVACNFSPPTPLVRRC